MDRVLNPASNVLITGATGFIGGEILQRLEEHTRGMIWSLVRPKNNCDIATRLIERYQRSGLNRGPAGHVQAVAGDVTCEGWNLSADHHEAITRQADFIIHCAADTSFAPNHDTRQTNVTGVQNLITLAQQCQRRPLIVYISTASNVGTTEHCCLTEDEGCQPDNEHFNGYTQSKAEAEALLRASGLSVLHLRPTIVLSANLPDPGFAKQILWCVPLMYLFRCLPLDASARLDLVDVGFVAEATLALLEHQGRHHDCYHLSAGVNNCTTIGQLRDVLHAHYKPNTNLRLVHPDDWSSTDQKAMLRTAIHRRLFLSLRHYMPFLNMDVLYDDSRLRSDLGQAAPRVQPPAEYLPSLLRLIRHQAALQEAALP
jgi:nucleoside-diphosphate-sugar epimerase